MIGRNEPVKKDDMNQPVNENSKDQQLEQYRSGHDGEIGRAHV